MKVAPLAIWLWYRGTTFRGFQRQPVGPTVQGRLVEALASVGVGATPNPAGRTDRGVHARMQVVSVRAAATVAPEAVQQAINGICPGELGALLCRRAHPSFHAQWQTRGKEYRYRLSLAGPPPAPWRPYAWEVSVHPRLLGRAAPSPQRVLEVLALAVGKRDFWAFHEKSSVRRKRHLRAVELAEPAPGVFELRLMGESFARYQVRYLVGGAVAVASGELAEADYRDALETGREIPGLKAPPEGLALWSTAYPVELDPFTAEERDRAPGLPAEPPF